MTNVKKMQAAIVDMNEREKLDYFNGQLTAYITKAAEAIIDNINNPEAIKRNVEFITMFVEQREQCRDRIAEMF